MDSQSSSIVHSPTHPRDIINKFEINDNKLMRLLSAEHQQQQQHRPAALNVHNTYGNSGGSVGGVFVTTCEPIGLIGGKITSKATTPTLVETTQLLTTPVANITQIEDNIDRIMKFACVTVLKSPVGGQQPSFVDVQTGVTETPTPTTEKERRFSNESVEITDQNNAHINGYAAKSPGERRQSVSLTQTPSESQQPDANANVTIVQPVVLRKKSVSYNSRQSSMQPPATQQQPSIKSSPAGGADDQTPELMKVFARRSLKLKDSFYVSDEMDSLASDQNSLTIVHDNVTTIHRALNNNPTTVKPTATTTSIHQNELTKLPTAKPTPTSLTTIVNKSSVGPVTVAATTALASAWLSNCHPTLPTLLQQQQQPPGKVVPAKVVVIMQPVVGTVHQSHRNSIVGVGVNSKQPLQQQSGNNNNISSSSTVIAKPHFNNNIVINNNNNNTNNNINVNSSCGPVLIAAAAGTNGFAANDDKANANIMTDGLQQRHSCAATTTTMASRASDEFKGILQRKAEWEKRATQQFK